MLVSLTIYLILVVITWFYSGFISGRELAEVKHRQQQMQAPPQYFQINYVNLFFQGICWPAYWLVLFGIWWFDRSREAPNTNRQSHHPEPPSEINEHPNTAKPRSYDRGA